MSTPEASFYEPIQIGADAYPATQVIQATTHVVLKKPFDTKTIKQFISPNNHTSETLRQMNCVMMMSQGEQFKAGTYSREFDPRAPKRIAKRVAITTRTYFAADDGCIGCHFAGSGTVGCNIKEQADGLYREALNLNELRE